MNVYRRLEMLEITNKRKEEYKSLVRTTHKIPLEYKIGEKMIFKIRVKHMDTYLDIPYIWCLVISDDGQKREEYIEKTRTDGFILRRQ